VAVFLDQPPGGLAVEVPADQAGRVRRHRPEERSFLVVLDAGPSHVGQDRPGGVEQDLPSLLVPLLGRLRSMVVTEPRDAHLPLPRLPEIIFANEVIRASMSSRIFSKTDLAGPEMLA
jgi:hypothetical protein